jgi:integral membrane protein (TIGR01906 family)
MKWSSVSRSAATCRGFNPDTYAGPPGSHVCGRPLRATRRAGKTHDEYVLMSMLRYLAKWLVGALVPFALIMVGVRLLLTPMYLSIEQGLPGFPPDDYGFTAAERLHWSAFGIRYLLNDSPPSYLGELTFADGQLVFTEREVNHMHDVKLVVTSLLRTWYAVLLLLALMGLGAWRAGWLGTFWAGLRLGGALTLAIAGMAALVGTVGASGSGDLFWEFFSGFHGLFFSGDSWLFQYSDTLIRLYPLRFWQDSVLYVGLLAAGTAAALTFGLRETPDNEGSAA